MLYIPFPLNYKSFRPKRYEDSVHRNNEPSFQGDVINVCVINKLIKEKSKKLIPFPADRIVIRGLSNLDHQQLYFTYSFLRQCFEQVLGESKDEVQVQKFIQFPGEDIELHDDYIEHQDGMKTILGL